MIGMPDCPCGNERLNISREGVIRCPVCTRAAKNLDAWREAIAIERDGGIGFPGPDGKNPPIPPKRFSGGKR